MAQILMNFQTQNHDFSNYGLKSVSSTMQMHLSAEWNVSILKILWLSVLEWFYVDIIFIAFYHIVGLIRLRYKSSTSNIIIVIINISSISSTLCSEKNTHSRFLLCLNGECLDFQTIFRESLGENKNSTSGKVKYFFLLPVTSCWRHIFVFVNYLVYRWRQTSYKMFASQQELCSHKFAQVVSGQWTVNGILMECNF